MNSLTDYFSNSERSANKMQNEEINSLAKIIWDYHHMNYQLEKADCIFVLGSQDTRVAEYAADLFLQGYAPYILFSGGAGKFTKDIFKKSEAEIFADIALKKAVPKEKIIIENKSTNTSDNIRFSKVLLQELHFYFNNFILVQKPYMERRTYAAFKKLWPEKSFIVTSPQICFENYPTEEISKERMINIMVGDLQRIKEYPALGYQITQDIPESVWQAYEKLVGAGFTECLIKDQKKVLYNEKLGNEWIEWVEKDNSKGSREQEIFPLIKKWLSDVKPENLLDIGCGQGVCSTIIDETISYVGIDPSSVLIERAQKLYTSSNRKFIVGDALALPIENEAFKAEMSIWVWSHLQDLETASKEMFRTLLPGGTFLIITANPDTYEERKTFYKLYEENNGLLVGTFDLGEGNQLTDSTLYLYSKEYIKESIKSSGLVIDSFDKLGQLQDYPKGLYIAIQGHRTE